MYLALCYNQRALAWRTAGAARYAERHWLLSGIGLRSLPGSMLRRLCRAPLPAVFSWLRPAYRLRSAAPPLPDMAPAVGHGVARLPAHVAAIPRIRAATLVAPPLR